MTPLPSRPARQLPPGVRDLFGAPARHLRALERTLLQLLDGWGYQEVVPPTFEYYDNVMRAFDEAFAAEIYRFVDPDGHLLALRPDLTVPVARLVATKLYDQPLPQRLCYAAPVFRFAGLNSHEPRQVWQAGWELIGVASASADAETLALLVSALRAVGLEQFQVNLGHMGFVRAALAEARLEPAALSAVLRAVDRKNRRMLAQVLDGTAVAGRARRVLEALPELWGGAAVLAEALDLAPSEAARAALRHLQAVLHQLEGYGVAGAVTVDLGEVRGMDYYTGITFEVFAAGSGFAIASGGRYDDLLARFGADLPAVGAMVQLERVLGVLHHTRGEPLLPPPDALQQRCAHAACLQQLLQRRQAGARIELDLLDRSAPELWAEAARRGIPEVIECRRMKAEG